MERNGEMTHTSTINVKTPQRDAMIDITSQVESAVRKAGVSEGFVVVHVPHTTAGVTINENADPDVVHDVLRQLDACVPWRQDFYRHSEGNSAAHVKSSLVGCNTTIPISGGSMALGTWQAVFFCEFDGPRSRRVVISVTGE
jgi:secondary thiamine-phosphate synthase enzyme